MSLNNLRHRAITDESGFSLVEMIVVVLLITILSAIGFTKLYNNAPQTGGSEQVLEEIAGRISERRADAVRLNDEDSRLPLTVKINLREPLSIDFTNAETTASLRTEGTDQDRDCVDDYTGLDLTCIRVSKLGFKTIKGTYWSSAYQDNFLDLNAQNWSVVTDAAQLARYGVPTLGLGGNGRGNLIYRVGFDARGKALGYENGTWQKYPVGAYVGNAPALDTTPFWVVYALPVKLDQGFATPIDTTPIDQPVFNLDQTTSPIIISNPKPIDEPVDEIVPATSAIAVAVYPSGVIEKFRWDGDNWIGFGNRTLQNSDVY